MLRPRTQQETVAPEYLQHIARLAKLEVPPARTEELCRDLGKILAAVRHIQEVNTEGTSRGNRRLMSPHVLSRGCTIGFSLGRHTTPTTGG
jgi:hypothetical protein